MPEVRREDFRHRGRLHLREIADGRQAVPVQDQPGNPAAAHRAGAGAKDPEDRQERPAGKIHLQGRQAVPGVSGDGQEGQGHVRLPVARIIRAHWRPAGTAALPGVPAVLNSSSGIWRRRSRPRANCSQMVNSAGVSRPSLPDVRAGGRADID